VRLASLFTVAGLAVVLAGCETLRAENCDPSAAANPDVVFDGGQTLSCTYSSSRRWPDTPTGSFYQGEWLWFPGGMHYALEHGLGCAPTSLQAWVSFDRYGTRNGGIDAPAAGDQANILAADATTIRIANGECADYWLLVTASVDPATCAACSH